MDVPCNRDPESRRVRVMGYEKDCRNSDQIPNPNLNLYLNPNPNHSCSPNPDSIPDLTLTPTVILTLTLIPTILTKFNI